MKQKVTFNNSTTPFMDNLNEKVNKYFKDRNIKRTGNWKLYTKSLILFPAHIGLYILMISLHLNPIYNVLAAILLGISSALIGFNVMHDGSHGGYSKNKILNSLMAYSANLIGAEAHFWRTKHNVLHHTYTNVVGMDDDIDKHPLFRFCEQQEHKPMHRFQYIYWIFLYPLSSIGWLYYGDFKTYFTGKILDYSFPKMSTQEHIIFWITKLINPVLFIIIPIYSLGIVPGLLCFLSMHFVLSYILNIVFQLAHVVEGTSFARKQDGKIQKEWAIHQVETTADFATKSKLVSWFVGGLNFQVEHHLFPKISHVHYPAINKFVRETCKQFNVKYIENPTFIGAFWSHIRYLKQLGVN
ncbi:MAG: acyl-CoA desaturase [Bacteroidota bacterium]|nr:acyl-CoA desaturase [Bacteroidota bacterium]